LKWIVVVATHPAAFSPSTVIMPRPAPLLDDAPIINHQLLPDMDPTPTVGDLSASRVADYLGKTLNEIRLSRQDTIDRAATAKAPKTASK
jgi:hypothetical protein